jgi:hypothetical protein
MFLFFSFGAQNLDSLPAQENRGADATIPRGNPHDPLAMAVPRGWRPWRNAQAVE